MYLELDFSTDGSTLFVGSRGQQPSGFPSGAQGFFRFDPNTGDAVDGFDLNGTINCYICDISTTTSQGGPGSGPDMSPQRIVLLPPPEPDGDFDDGGFWDLADLNLVLFNWQQSEANLPQEWINQRPATVGLDSLNLVLFNWQPDKSRKTTDFKR